MAATDSSQRSSRKCNVLFVVIRDPSYLRKARLSFHKYCQYSNDFHCDYLPHLTALLGQVAQAREGRGWRKHMIRRPPLCNNHGGTASLRLEGFFCDDLVGDVVIGRHSLAAEQKEAEMDEAGAVGTGLVRDGGDER